MNIKYDRRTTKEYKTFQEHNIC